MKGETTPIENSQQPRSRRRRGILIRIALWLFIPYVTIAAMLAIFQRQLIYLPTREAVSTADAGYPDGQLHEIQVETDDGLTLHGWLVLADGHTSESAEIPQVVENDASRLIVYFAGNGGHRAFRLKEIRQLTGLGNHVLYVDYRGYAENDGKPAEEDLARDARCVWRYATLELGASPERIVIWGESLGGGVATRLTSELCAEGSVPGGLILRSSFTALTDAAAYHYPWLPVRWLLVERYPSIERIPQVTCPLIVIHGRQDRIVPFEQGESLFAAAPAQSHNGVPKTFVELPGAGHNDVMYVAADEVEIAVGAFLGQLP